MKKMNKDERLRKKFYKNYRKYIANTGLTEEEMSKADSLLYKLVSNGRFNPILHLSFEQVCTIDIRDGNDKVIYRNKRLLNRNATTIYCQKSFHYVHENGEMDEYKELWLTEDMELVLTHCTVIDNGQRKIAYRYIEDENIAFILPGTTGITLLEYLIRMVDEMKNNPILSK